MADPIQCLNCGAILLDEDLFCGECGSPRPVLGDAATTVVGHVGLPSAQEIPQKSGTLPPRSTPATHPGWRAAAFVLLGFGALVCMVGILVFFVAGSTPSEDFTTSENWLFSAGCCLLPIAGFGVLLAAAGVAIWYTRLRNV